MKHEYYDSNVIKMEPEDALFNVTVAEHIAKHMRYIDVIECEIDGDAPIDALLYSMATSELMYAIFANDEPWMVFGYGDDMVWALGTFDADNHKKAMVTAGRDFIKEVLAKHPRVYNYISVENTKALRFIKHMGARFSKPFLVNGKQFVQFVLEK